MKPDQRQFGSVLLFTMSTRGMRGEIRTKHAPDNLEMQSLLYLARCYSRCAGFHISVATKRVESWEVVY